MEFAVQDVPSPGIEDAVNESVFDAFSACSRLHSVLLLEVFFFPQSAEKCQLPAMFISVYTYLGNPKDGERFLW